jgi:prefoldin beta subunit
VSQEFKLLEDDANVFKLVGPVLVKQDLQEARANVDKRIDYIKEELVRVDGQTKESEKKLESQRNKVMAHQAQMQQQKRQQQ